MIFSVIIHTLLLITNYLSFLSITNGWYRFSMKNFFDILWALSQGDTKIDYSQNVKNAFLKVTLFAFASSFTTYSIMF